MSAAAVRRDFRAGGGWSRRAALEPCGQIPEVPSIKADGSADVDCGELAALDQALNGARMDVKQLGHFSGRKERDFGARLGRVRLGATGSDRMSWRFRAAAFRMSLTGRALVGNGLVEERQLTRCGLHGDRVTYQIRAPGATRR